MEPTSTTNNPTIIENYEQRLKNLPTEDPETKATILKLEDEIDTQQTQLKQQNQKIKVGESELIKLEKFLEQRENEIQELSESEEKNSAKEKKYFMQISNYNKKIESYKEQNAKLTKDIALAKKDNKNLETTMQTIKSESKKILSALTKGQIKKNTLSQTLNDLKMKIMATANGGNNALSSLEEEIKRDEKAIQEIFTAVKKQLALIDILKRQKVHVVASTVFKYCEEEFEKVLESNSGTGDQE